LSRRNFNAILAGGTASLPFRQDNLVDSQTLAVVAYLVPHMASTTEHPYDLQSPEFPHK
jgi:hypothetical protein